MTGSDSMTGNGSMTGTVDEIDADGTPNSTPSATLIFTLTDTARGRGTVTTNTALLPANLAFYIVSPSKIRLISTDSGDQHPQVEAIVVVDEPRGAIYGTEVAAPAWKQIMNFALPYLKIAPG